MTRKNVDHIVRIAQAIHGPSPVPLHRPIFDGNERRYLVECIDSNFVSSVGARVNEFERQVADFMGMKHGIATVNGTAALHVALRLAGASQGEEVITQAVTFIATCNALSYIGAKPVFVDVDIDTMGMSPDALRSWLHAHAERVAGGVRNRATGRRIAACVPMHTFGHPCRIEAISEICEEWGIPLVEDAAESLGSWSGERHTGRFGRMAALSFNGNKLITTGGGGMIVTDDDALAKHAKHVTTTAKVPHPYEFVHDELGFNYRLPNLNAALGCAQMERISEMLEVKAAIATRYREELSAAGVRFFADRPGTRPNHWLNAIIAEDLAERDAIIQGTNAQGVMTRPIWRLMPSLPMYKDCETDGLANSRWLEERVVNIPSSVPNGALENKQ
jgi:aminotransferase in exopolysaccharide biosynthesis